MRGNIILRLEFYPSNLSPLTGAGLFVNPMLADKNADTINTSCVPDLD